MSVNYYLNFSNKHKICFINIILKQLIFVYKFNATLMKVPRFDDVLIDGTFTLHNLMALVINEDVCLKHYIVTCIWIISFNDKLSVFF